jgi:hypothetical protein
MSIIAKLGEIGEGALTEVSKAASLDDIEKVRLQVLGK